MSNAVYVPRIDKVRCDLVVRRWLEGETKINAFTDSVGILFFVDGFTTREVNEAFEFLSGGVYVDDSLMVYDTRYPNVSRETILSKQRCNFTINYLHNMGCIPGSDRVCYPTMPMNQAQFTEKALERDGLRLSIIYGAMRRLLKLGYTERQISSKLSELEPRPPSLDPADRLVDGKLLC